MGSMSSRVTRSEMPPRPRSSRREGGVVAAFVGLVLAIYVVAGYAVYLALASLL